MKKKVLPLILLLVLSLTVVPALGAGEIEPSRTGSITVVFRPNTPGNGVLDSDGVAVYLWQIAEVSGTGAHVDYAPLPGFEDINFVVTEAAEWDNIARQVWEVIRADDDLRTGARSAFVEGGSVTFTDVDPGLYLLRFLDANVTDNVEYEFTYAMVLVPGQGEVDEDTGEWDWTYDVSVYPKYTRETIPEETESETVPEETVPETVPETQPTPPPPDEPPPDEPPPDEPPPDEPPPDEEVPDEPTPLTPPDFPPDEDLPDEPTPLAPPDIPDEEIPENPIPKTGFLWWPVPVFGILGTVLLLTGIGIRKSGERKHNV